ncbi:MAG: hypothetical protein ABIQ35_08325 [Verrucomicrobiota bacterium]
MKFISDNGGERARIHPATQRRTDHDRRVVSDEDLTGTHNGVSVARTAVRRRA